MSNRVELDWICQPYGLVGGDACVVRPLDDGRVVFFIADVSGKGVPASLIAHHLS
jgi:serine phosphatase RsbU (regulator of sigma subunit)